MNSNAHHCSTTSILKTDPQRAFLYLDDPKKLSTHMEKSSWMMMGSKMEMQLDSKQGREVESKIILKGQILGIDLLVQEAVTQRQPPHLKEWETFGQQKMLIIDWHKMGFRLKEKKDLTELEVYIDYSLPPGPIARIFAPFLARIYAQWCVNKMAQDAALHFKT